MRPGIHPPNRTVAFRDAASGTTYRIRSTVPTDQTVELHGRTYPLVVAEISAASHPFWTGTQRVLGAAGRVRRFHQRYGARGNEPARAAARPPRAAERGMLR